MNNAYDAIVIGAGHNGLSAAATLAKSGKKVLVLEQADTIGGMAATTEIAPGFRCSETAHLLYNLSPEITRGLKLSAHGLRLAVRDMETVSLSPEGHHVVIRGDQARYVDGTPHAQAAAYAALYKRLIKFAKLLKILLYQTPPKLENGGIEAAMAWGSWAVQLRLLGKKQMQEFLRIILTNSYDLILDEIDDGPLAGALALDSIAGNTFSPRAPGSALSLLYRLSHGGRYALPVGGMGAVSDSMRRAVERYGVEIKTGAAVKSVDYEQDRVTGVALASGKSFATGLVLSSVDPKRTLGFTGPEPYDAEMVRRIHHHRSKGVTAKLNLALSAAPVFSGLSDALTRGRLIIAPDMSTIELAHNATKYNKTADQLVMEITIPSLADPSLVQAQEGHVLSAIIHYVANEPEGGWNEAGRASLSGRALNTLEAYAPGIGKLVQAQQLLSPADLGARFGSLQGHWHHGDMIVDQLIMLRPVNGMGRYATSLSGLYFAGASAHPGGDVMGIAGRNAARQALKDMG